MIYTYMFFFDWLEIMQEFDYQLPVVGDRHSIVVESSSGEELGLSQFPIKHEGSFSTSITIKISGNRITMKGNPSRIGRLDNLFGFTSIDQCVAIYNSILSQYGLPHFTKTTSSYFSNGKADKASVFTDGATIKELHITMNVSTGYSNQTQFIRAMSTQPYRNLVPELKPNGRTCHWLNKSGKGAYIYPSVYDKAFEIELHMNRSIKRMAEESEDYKYLKKLIEFCDKNGVVRFEQKLKSKFLSKHKLNKYGHVDMNKLITLNEEFLAIQQKLSVNAISFETVTEELIRKNICTNTKSANTTALYVVNWMHGTKFDTSKSQVQMHRSRLRKIGIDIALPCDLNKFSMIRVKEMQQIETSILSMPYWYVKPNHLKAA